MHRLLLALLLLVPLTVHAQPAGAPITLVVPYAAGGITDVLARLLAERLAARLGVSVVAENRTGAGGLIGAQAAARGRPDGTTLFMHSSAIMAVAANSAEARFEPMAELAPVIFIAGLPSVLAVNPAVPAHTMPELLAWLRANPGRANCGNLGEGANDHRACLALERATGSRIEHVTYRGLPPLDLDLMAGTIHLALGSAPIQVPLAREGKIRILAVGTAERVASMPDVPTLLESGIEFETLAVNAIFVPAATPQPVVERLNREIAAILAEPAVRERIEATGSILGSTDIPSLRARFQREWERALSNKQGG
jgi:tripartite-type tricarboxylate transporter receptor subunit TctC